MRRTLVAAILLSSMLWIAVQADVELVYTSGDTIQGSDVERDGDYYVLTKHDGSTVQIPLSDITDADCKTVETAMTKCSTWLPGHDQAAAARAPVPGSSELKNDIEALSTWVAAIRNRRA